jgi:hypothetical protein
MSRRGSSLYRFDFVGKHQAAETQMMLVVLNGADHDRDL